MPYSCFLHRAFAAVVAISLAVTAPAALARVAFASPAADQPLTVRVGFPELKYISEINEDGSYCGLVYDYVLEIAKYTGWNIQFVTGDERELTQMLIDGKIDLMGGLLKNEQTRELFDFTEYNSGYSYSVLAVDKDSQAYNNMDYPSFNHMRVAILQNEKTRMASYEEFCRSNSISPRPVYFDNQTEYEGAIIAGKADAILTSDASVTENQRVVARFAAIPYYFGVTKGNSQVLRGLNSALLKILEISPQMDMLLYKRYFENGQTQALSLTESEKQYIAARGPLRVVLVPNYSPIGSFHAKTNTYSGIGLDILTQVSQLTGLQFEYIYTNTFDESRGLLDSGQADLLATLTNNPKNAERYNLTLTTSYFSTQAILVKNNQVEITDPSSKVLAMPRGFEFAQYSVNPDMVSVLRYDTIEDCIRAVNTGQADYTYSNSLVTEHYVRGRSYRNIALVPMTSIGYGLCIGLARPTDPNLISIVDKALNSIPAEQVQSFVFQNTALSDEGISFASLIYADPAPFAILLAILLLAGVASIVCFTLMRYHLMRRIALDDERYRILGELANEYIFEYNFKKNELLFSDKFAKLIGKKRLTTRERTLGGARDQSEDAFLKAFDQASLKPSIDTELCLRMSDGREEWFRLIATVIYSYANKPQLGIGKLMSIKKERELAQQASLDTLTGLYNRRRCEELIREFLTNQAQSQSGALMVIDIDHFKEINDTLGHLAGDEVLKNFADVLRSEFRTDDIFGRWGGDEFIVFLRNLSDIELVKQRARKLCTLMDKLFYWEEKTVSLSISMGVVMALPGAVYEDLFADADRALYLVKQGRRNGFELVEKITKERCAFLS